MPHGKIGAAPQGAAQKINMAKTKNDDLFERWQRDGGLLEELPMVLCHCPYYGPIIADMSYEKAWAVWQECPARAARSKYNPAAEARAKAEWEAEEIARWEKVVEEYNMEQSQ